MDICTSNDAHFEIAMAAVEAGKPYDVEKPVTMTAAEADILAKATAEKGLPNMVCFSYRFKAAARCARELIEQSFCVIYFTAFDLFDLFARYTFSSSEEAKDAHANIFDCDLLIIDDLGTELTNSFVSSQLFLCINERILRKKSTIISTNLPLDRFMETYSERTFSRISSNYTIIKLFGNDIRIQKKLLGGTKA